MLPRSTPEAQGISSSALLAFVERSERTIDALHSVMLLRHGHVVAEGWWTPYAPQTLHELYSLSKSFTSTAIGLAIAEDRLSLDDTVVSFFDKDDLPAEPSANLQAMRIRDLLAMTSGHQDDTVGRLFVGGDGRWSRAFLHLDVEHKPGTHFVYNTGATYMLSAILQRTTGQRLTDYLRPRLFDKLGIEKPLWDQSPEGTDLGGWGLSVTTEDIARFGQLYLQRGVWNGERVLSEQWVAAASSRQTSNGSNPHSDWEQGYGYQFWRCRHNIYRGDGAFGQYCIVMPEQDAVLAITSGVGDMQSVLDTVWEELLPAMKTAPLGTDADAEDALRAKLATLQLTPQQGQLDAPLAQQISGRQYVLQEDDSTREPGAIELGPDHSSIETALFEFGAETVYSMRKGGIDYRIPVGRDTWALSEQGAMGQIAASGAWESDDTYALKIYYSETPYSSVLRFQFNGDAIVCDEVYHVSFGECKRPRLTGTAR